MRMVIAVDNSSSSRKAMSHGMAMADMMKDPPEVKIVYAIGLNPEQFRVHYRDSLDRRNNMDIREDARGEVEQIQSWLSEFSKKVY
ncbi:hypothetical protein BC943DRAFT_280648 [Umbelopsis sp. AD052]|nr:hypothetical protein BC943DRAFT_280648 [Umbelopsis sp. AD052]